MDVTPLIKADLQIIQSYKESRFQISGRVYPHPVLIFPDKVVKWDLDLEDQMIQSLDWPHVLRNLKSQIKELCEDCELLLLGTGASGEFISPRVRLEFSENKENDTKISLEVMSSAAACRTFNVVITEGRNIAAAILPVPI